MIHRFTISATYLGKGMLSEPEITSFDLDVSMYPSKVAVVRGVGYDKLKDQVKELKRKPFLNGRLAIDLEIEHHIWESL